MAVLLRELYNSVVPSVITYNEEGKFFIVKRSDDLKVFPDKWHVPREVDFCG